MKKLNLNLNYGFLFSGIFAGLFLLFLSLLLIFGFLLPPQYDQSFLGEMKYKLERLQETRGKRIILVGGSSIPFGLKSELLDEYFPDYEIVDFGMYAHMGTVVMLDWAKAEIHEGDIFIVMPEQNEQTLSSYFSGEDVWQASEGAFELISLLSASRYESLAASFPEFAGRKLFYTVYGTLAAEGIYSRSSFNEYGDISYGERVYNTMFNEYNPNDLISFSTTIITKDFIAELNDFAQYAAQEGASVYYHFSPMNEAALSPETTKGAIDAYYQFLQNQLDFPILGSPHTCILDSGWFYDTNFHLNDSGAVVFTKYLIEDLKTMFKDTSPTNITLPDLPVIPLTIADGDNSDVECFTYQWDENGWFINGLSEKGKSSSKLVIPVIYEEKPVFGISENLFSNNALISELTIQPNIGILYDNMFTGCRNLQKLILTGKPGDYMVGNDLMKGSNFLIYVSSEFIDQYRRDYSWNIYEQYLNEWIP